MLKTKINCGLTEKKYNSIHRKIQQNRLYLKSYIYIIKTEVHFGTVWKHE